MFVTLHFAKEPKTEIDGDETPPDSNSPASDGLDGVELAAELDPPKISARQLSIEAGDVVFVSGPNGVGKSSLLAEMAGEITRSGCHVETFFANRHIQFQSDDIEQIGQSLDDLQRTVRSATRYRNHYGEQHLKSVMRRIALHQAHASEKVIEGQRGGASFDDAMSANPLVIDSINGVFEAARLPVKIILNVGGLHASRDGSVYGINRLSDGERAALLLVGAALIQPVNSIIIVDEPERHLNPAISGALLAALTRVRKDIAFVFASHDLGLLEWLSPKIVLHVRNSIVISSEPEIRRYSLSVLDDQQGITHELRTAVLGSRRKLLLVEGEASSEDKALYGHIYPNWHVAARGGWEMVSNGVRALARNQDFHWLTTAGIIDRDGRLIAEEEKLALDDIHCLPVPTIENLFLHEPILGQMAAELHNLMGGQTGEQRLAAVRSALPNMLQTCKNEIVLKRIVWDANRQNSENKISPDDVRRGQLVIASVDLGEIRTRIEKEFDQAISTRDVFKMLISVPIKNSPVPTRVVKILGYDNFKSYSKAVLQQVEKGTPAGTTILAALRTIMPILPEPVDQEPHPPG